MTSLQVLLLLIAVIGMEPINLNLIAGMLSKSKGQILRVAVAFHILFN